MYHNNTVVKLKTANTWPRNSSKGGVSGLHSFWIMVHYRRPGPVSDFFLHDLESFMSTYLINHIILGMILILTSMMRMQVMTTKTIIHTDAFVIFSSAPTGITNQKKLPRSHFSKGFG